MTTDRDLPISCCRGFAVAIAIAGWTVSRHGGGHGREKGAVRNRTSADARIKPVHPKKHLHLHPNNPPLHA